MAGLRKILVSVLVLFLVLLALVFSLNNQSEVSLDFLVFETPPVAISVWVMLAFIVGALTGLLIATLAAIRSSVSRRALRKKLSRAEKALDKSRAEQDRAP